MIWKLRPLCHSIYDGNDHHSSHLVCANPVHDETLGWYYLSIGWVTTRSALKILHTNSTSKFLCIALVSNALWILQIIFFPHSYILPPSFFPTIFPNFPTRYPHDTRIYYTRTVTMWYIPDVHKSWNFKKLDWISLTDGHDLSKSDTTGYDLATDSEWGWISAMLWSILQKRWKVELSCHTFNL